MKAFYLYFIFIALALNAKAQEINSLSLFLDEVVKDLNEEKMSRNKSNQFMTEDDFTEIFSQLPVSMFMPEQFCESEAGETIEINKYELRLIFARLDFKNTDFDEKQLKEEPICVPYEEALTYFAKPVWNQAIKYSPDGKYERSEKFIKEIKIKQLIKQLNGRFDLSKNNITSDGRLFKKGFLGKSLYWSIGDKFNATLREELQNPATISIVKSAGEERVTSVKAAARIRFTPLGSKNKWSWKPSVGYSLEKNNQENEPIDIRGIYTSLSKENCKRQWSVDLSKLDNFAQGNETLVANLKYYPLIIDDERKRCEENPENYNPWTPFSTGNMRFKEFPWRYFLKPGFEFEINQMQEKIDDPNLSSNDDSTFLIASLNAGLEKGDFEFKYSLNRRFDLDRNNDLTYQEFAINWYVDKKKRFSIGIEATKGRRPIDTFDIERYEFVIGYKR